MDSARQSCHSEPFASLKNKLREESLRPNLPAFRHSEMIAVASFAATLVARATRFLDTRPPRGGLAARNDVALRQAERGVEDVHD